MNVVEFPKSALIDIPLALRNLADAIEKGEHGETRNLVWVLDTAEGQLAVGMVGPSSEPVAVTYYMLGLAQNSLEQ